MESVGKAKQRQSLELRALRQEYDLKIKQAKKNKDEKKRLKKELKVAEAELVSKQKEEIRVIEEASKVDEPAEAVAPEPRKQTRAEKRRLKKQAEAAERERLAEEEANDMEDLRAIENASFVKQLAPLELGIVPIAADGHCLFRAIADQLKRDWQRRGGQGSNESQPLSFSEIRLKCSEHMRGHKGDFQPYLTNDNGDMLNDEEYEAYCNRVVGEGPGPVLWGGEYELVATSKVLQRDLVVHIANQSPREIKCGEDPTPLRVSFHKHYFGLGEHYNSVVPLLEIDPTIQCKS